MYHGSDGCGEYCVSHGAVSADVSSSGENMGLEVLRGEVALPPTGLEEFLLCCGLVSWVRSAREPPGIRTGGGGGGGCGDTNKYNGRLFEGRWRENDCTWPTLDWCRPRTLGGSRHPCIASSSRTFRCRQACATTVSPLHSAG